MIAYYNEHDRQKAAVLRECIKANLIAPGDVDERSIKDVQPADLLGYEQCHLFAGIGIWSYALRLAGWPDDRPVWTGSCPCPSFSAAGKGQGFDDPRHLWPDWFRLIRECRPATVFGEQASAAIGFGWIDLVQTDMEAEAYALGKIVFGAHSVGAPHIRQRTYFVADAKCFNAERQRFKLGRSPGKTQEEAQQWEWIRHDTGNGEPVGLVGHAEWIPCRSLKVPGAIEWRPIKPGTFVLADGYPGRVLALRCAGDAIVAPQAAEFVAAYMEARGDEQ